MLIISPIHYMPRVYNNLLYVSLVLLIRHIIMIYINTKANSLYINNLSYNLMIFSLYYLCY